MYGHDHEQQQPGGGRVWAGLLGGLFEGIPYSVEVILHRGVGERRCRAMGFPLLLALAASTVVALLAVASQQPPVGPPALFIPPPVGGFQSPEGYPSPAWTPSDPGFPTSGPAGPYAPSSPTGGYPAGGYYPPSRWPPDSPAAAYWDKASRIPSFSAQMDGRC